MTIKEIDASLEEGESLKQIAQAYSEIANLKIKKIRLQTERNRIFFQEISQIYALIKKLAIKKKINVVKSKKTASIVLTSNYRFYGSINSDLLEFFTTSTRKIETDRIVLGKAAIDYFKATNIFSSYQPVLLKDDQPNPQELAWLAALLKDYNQVMVFHSSLKSLLVQQPTVTDITPSSTANLVGEKEVPEFKFIFEPELAKILAFFDSSIITLLLEGTFLESELSRTASRFISMDTAETQANKFIAEYLKLKAYAKRSLANNTILENYASYVSVRTNVASMAAVRKDRYV